MAPTGWYSDWDGLGDPGWLPPQTWHLGGGGDSREAGSSGTPSLSTVIQGPSMWPLPPWLPVP